MPCKHCPDHCPTERPEMDRAIYIVPGITDKEAQMLKTTPPYRIHEHKFGEPCNDLCKYVSE